MVKRLALSDWATYSEVFGQPMRLGKYDASASAADVKTLWRAVRSLSREAAAVLPESMQIEFVQAAGGGKSGPEVYEKLVTYLDQQISKAALGQTTTTDAVSGGHAVSKEHRKVAEDIERSDARDLAATINRDIIKPLVAFNIGPLARYPRLRIGRAEEHDLAGMLKAIQVLLPAGVPLSKSQLQKVFRLEEPKDAGDTLATSPAAAAPKPPKDDKTEASAIALAAVDPPRGPMERIEEDIVELDGWEAIVDPKIKAAETSLKRSRTPKQATAALAELGDDKPSEEATDMIARAMFAGRIAGRLGVGSDDA